MVHRFKNVSDQMARLWCVVVPAGLEAFFAEIGRPTEQGVFTPPPAMTPEDMVRIRAIAERYGQVLYPPDHFDKLHKSDEQKKSGPAHDIPATHDAKVNGIGGIFFKCNDPKAVMAWYKEHLGFNTTAYGAGFDWQEVSGRKKSTQWSPFPATTKYMDPSVKDFMINYRVDNLEKLVEQLKKANVTILDTIETYEYGKFIHIIDIEGNKIELYEPNYEHAAKK
jgi:predicted enzyme related to lactoylglutathione lyase